MSIFDTSITGLADLYEYLLPESSSSDDETTELDLRKSEVSVYLSLSLSQSFRCETHSLTMTLF